jgi:hypothetical protein
MLKIDLLRDALIVAMPELKATPKNLVMWADRGTVQSQATDDLAFEIGFQLNVLLIDFAGDKMADFALAILIWLRSQQPDRLAIGVDAFDFEVDILDHGKVDLQIRLQLRQSVGVESSADGAKANYLPEPEPFFVDDLPIGGLEVAPNLKSISLNDEELLPWNTVDGG